MTSEHLASLRSSSISSSSQLPSSCYPRRPLHCAMVAISEHVSSLPSSTKRDPGQSYQKREGVARSYPVVVRAPAAGFDPARGNGSRFGASDRRQVSAGGLPSDCEGKAKP